MRTLKARVPVANFQTYLHHLPPTCAQAECRPTPAALPGAGGFAPPGLTEVLSGTSHRQEMFLWKPAALFITLEIHFQFYNIKASALCFHL